jgi:hypothetical protein
MYTKLFWERRKRLLNDAERDELNRLELRLLRMLNLCFGGTEEQIKEYV